MNKRVIQSYYHYLWTPKLTSVYTVYNYTRQLGTREYNAFSSFCFFLNYLNVGHIDMILIKMLDIQPSFSFSAWRSERFEPYIGDLKMGQMLQSVMGTQRAALPVLLAMETRK